MRRALELLLVVAIASTAAARESNICDAVVHDVEGQVCYLRCSGNQQLRGALKVDVLDAGVLNVEGQTNVARAGGNFCVGSHNLCWTDNSGTLTYNAGGAVSFGNTNVSTNATWSSNTTGGSDAFSITAEGARLRCGPDTYWVEQGTRIRATAGIDGTAGSGTGITTNQTSAIAHQVHKLTVINTALAAAATTDITIWTTPANTRLLRITANVTQVFTGGALSAMTVQCGSAAGGNQYLLAGSVFAAQTTLGDVAAEIGAGLLSATAADMGAPAAGVPAAITISCRFTCTGANCSAATQGSVTFNIEHVVYP